MISEDDLRAASVNAGPVTVEWIPIMQRWRWHAIAVNEEGHAPSVDLAIMQAFEKVSEIHQHLYKALGYPAWETTDPEVKVYDENGEVEHHDPGVGKGIHPGASV